MLHALSWDADLPDAWGFRGSGALVGVASATVGLVIALKQPSNPIGWVSCALGVMSGISESSLAYANYVFVVREQANFLAEVSAWLGNWMWMPIFGTVAVGVFMLFPDGRFISARWRAVAVVSTLVTILLSLTYSLLPGPLENTPYLTNPFGFQSLHNLLPFPDDLLIILIVVPVGSATGSLVVRFRRASGSERQQVKWLAAAAVAFVITLPFNILPYKVFQYATIVTLNALPVACGIAILRHRLYDIDLIINRALVYGTLTVSLGLTYFGGVLLLQAAFRGVTGDESTVALVVSTLAIAAGFQPLRRRVQAGIDRSFYRNRYDASRILAEFGATARDEVDLDRLTTALTSAVNESMRPSHISVWIRPDSN